MKSKLGMLALAVMLLMGVSLVVGCAPEETPTSTQEPTSGQQEAIELKYATFRPPADPQSEEWLKPMCEEIEKQTDGRVEFKIYWSEALGKSTDQYSLVKDGVADMTDFAGAWVPGKFNLSKVGNLPFASQNPENLLKTMYSLYDDGYFDSQYNEVEFLGWTSTPAYKFLFREKKPATFGELDGLKARAAGGLATKCEEEIGLVPVTVAPGDAYTAWQTGLVDVWVHPAGAVKKYKFYELPTEALLDVGFFTMVNSGNIFNKQKFNSLPADIQDTIKEVVRDYSYVYLESGLNTEEDAMALLEEHGIEVYSWPEEEVNKLKSAAVPVWDNYISELEEKDLPGKELVGEFIERLKGFGEEPPSPPSLSN